MAIGNLLVEKTKAFALKSIAAYERLKGRREYVLSKQFLRSATSIGANVAEGQYAQSRADFLAKYSIALKEASETKYWIELMIEAGYLHDSESTTMLVADCEEVICLLAAAVKKLKGDQKK